MQFLFILGMRFNIQLTGFQRERTILLWLLFSFLKIVVLINKSPLSMNGINPNSLSKNEDSKVCYFVLLVFSTLNLMFIQSTNASIFVNMLPFATWFSFMFFTTLILMTAEYIYSLQPSFQSTTLIQNLRFTITSNLTQSIHLSIEQITTNFLHSRHYARHREGC